MYKRQALEAARQFEGPVIVHVITEKGKGYLPAEQHDEDRFHAVNKIDELTGAPLTTAAKRCLLYTSRCV